MKAVAVEICMSALVTWNYLKVCVSWYWVICFGIGLMEMVLLDINDSEFNYKKINFFKLNIFDGLSWFWWDSILSMTKLII